MKIIISGNHIHNTSKNKAYIAKLSKPTGKYYYDRVFIEKQVIRIKAAHFKYEWNITEPGVYEKIECHPSMPDSIKYFAINNEGSIVKLDNKYQVNYFLSGFKNWEEISWLHLSLKRFLGDAKKITF